MSETEDIGTEYASLQNLLWDGLPEGSFLDWSSEKIGQRRKFFSNATTQVDALTQIARKFPNVLLIRGADFSSPFGIAGDFFIGNHSSALLYAQYDTRHQIRKHPVLVYCKLTIVLDEIMKGGIVLPYNTQDISQLILDGVINISLSSASEKKLFSLAKPTFKSASQVSITDIL